MGQNIKQQTREDKGLGRNLRVNIKSRNKVGIK